MPAADFSEHRIHDCAEHERGTEAKDVLVGDHDDIRVISKGGDPEGGAQEDGSAVGSPRGEDSEGCDEELEAEEENQDREQDREQDKEKCASQPHVSLFKKHADPLQPDRLSIAGLSSAMDDLGLLSCRSEKESQDVVVATFATLDVERKNYLTSDEFGTLYEKATMPTLADVLREEDPRLVERLELVYVKFATFGKRDRSSSVGVDSVGAPEKEDGGNNENENEKAHASTSSQQILMGTPAFVKLLRDADVVRHSDDIHHFDVIFAKVKERGASKISFAQFVDALRLIADSREGDLTDLVARICDAVPSMNLTPRESPRKDATTAPTSRASTASTKGSPTKRPIHIDVMAVSSVDDLQDVFAKYARFGKRDANREANNKAGDLRLSSQQFSKLARESGLVTRAVSIQKLDVMFASCKSKTTPRTLGISFDEFLVALQLVAKSEGVMVDYIMNKVRSRTDVQPSINSPALLQSPAGFVRLHDDERAHCGMYGRRLSSTQK